MHYRNKGQITVNWAVKAPSESHFTKMALKMSEKEMHPYSTIASKLMVVELVDHFPRYNFSAYSNIPFKLTLFKAEKSPDDPRDKNLTDKVHVLDLDVYDQCPMINSDAFYNDDPPEDEEGKG